MKNILIKSTCIFLLLQACKDPANAPTPTLTKQPNVVKGDTGSHYTINGTKQLGILEKQNMATSIFLNYIKEISSTEFTAFSIELKSISNERKSYTIVSSNTKISENAAYVGYQITKNGTNTIYNASATNGLSLYMDIDDKGRKVFYVQQQTFMDYFNNFKRDTLQVSAKMILLE